MIVGSVDGDDNVGAGYTIRRDEAFPLEDACEVCPFGSYLLEGGRAERTANGSVEVLFGDVSSCLPCPIGA
eukprot:1353770-Rhodomonas_salina.4